MQYAAKQLLFVFAPTHLVERAGKQGAGLDGKEARYREQLIEKKKVDANPEIKPRFLFLLFKLQLISVELV